MKPIAVRPLVAKFFGLATVVGICLAFRGATRARADLPESPSPPAGADGESAIPKPRSAKGARSSKGRHPREKDTEGTEARNRFQADPVLKSKYELNGQPLEVDPD